MNTLKRLNHYLSNQVPGSDTGGVRGAIHFLCSEIDRLQTPAKVSYKLCSDDAQSPVYQTAGASGLDLHARAVSVEPYGMVSFPFSLAPGASVMVWSGVAFAIPDGWEIQVRPRSSVSKQQIHVCLGTIDSDYRGEVGALLVNLGKTPFLINKNDRVAQAVFAPIGVFVLERVEVLDSTERGEKGFGSSGK